MKTVKFLLPVVLVAALLAGCGGGGSSASLGSDDVAAVGGTHITKLQFAALITQAKNSFKQNNRPFPKQGTSDYETIKGQAMTLLVQQAEREEKAKSLGINISDSDVQKRLTQIKKQYFKGSDKQYLQRLAQQHLTDKQVRDDIRAQLVSEALFNKVTKDTKVSSSDVHAYYVAHPQLYSQPQSRAVRHILVKSKALAASIFSQLKAGNDQTWCTLAKKYSQDPSSKNACGKLTVSKGQTVPPFDKVAFSQRTKTIHAPVYSSQYGYFVIEPLTSVKPRSSTPEKQVSDSIKQQLLQNQKNQAMTTWVSDLTKSFCSSSKVKYQVGYSPSPDPCTVTTTGATTTTQ
jgi:parvulin-like peptidyl-prolyl isomerase